MARKKRLASIEASIIWAKLFPLREMTKEGWLPKAENIHEKTMALLGFFGFADHSAWENYYFNQQLKVAFRISLADTWEPYAISAWLRKGELQAAGLQAINYSDRCFREAL